MKDVSIIKKHETSYGEESQKIVSDATRKENDSVVGREIRQAALLDFFIDSANLIMISEV